MVGACKSTGIYLRKYGNCNNNTFSNTILCKINYHLLVMGRSIIDQPDGWLLINDLASLHEQNFTIQIKQLVRLLYIRGDHFLYSFDLKMMTLNLGVILLEDIKCLSLLLVKSSQIFLVFMFFIFSQEQLHGSTFDGIIWHHLIVFQVY